MVFTIFVPYVCCVIYGIIMGGKSLRWTFVLAIILSAFSSRICTYFCLSQFCLYYVYFLLGYIKSMNKIKLCQRKMIGLCLCIIPLILSLWLNDGGHIKHSLFILMSFSVVIGLYCLVSSSRNKVLMVLSKNSYGIYLFHSPLIYFMYMLYPSANPIVMFTVNFIVCGFISLGLVYKLRTLGLKFIIGEK